MNLTPLIRSALAAGLAALAMQAAGQNMLEILQLRHRTAEQVLPALRPLVEPGGTLTGQGSQLIVRVSPANFVELQRALEAIDRPSRRLQISVRFDEAIDAASQDIEASGRISNRGSRIDVRGQDSRTAGSERVDQRLQVLEGGRAFIMTGRSTPLRDLETGFDAVARVAGDTVLVDIAPRRETPTQQQYLATTVSARLGEWVEVGGAVENRTRASESRRVWIKIEQIP
jgi:type II secretory pathway component GspD/PulD (secretin)